MKQNPFFDLSLDFLCTAGLDGVFRTVNPTFMRTLGYTEEELLEKPFVHFVHPDDRAATVAALEELRDGADVVNFSNRYRCKDGTYRWLEWSCPGAEPGSDIVYAVARDVTEKRRILEQLEAARKTAEDATQAKSEFLANVSHEIRTPMNAIIGVAELLAATSLSSEQRDYLSMVTESAESLLRLLNDLLDFSKIEAGRLELESIGFRLRESVGRTTRALALRGAEKGLDVHFRVAPGLPDHLVGDPGRLRQIIVNLIGNAIKFTHEGDVMVEVEEVPGGATADSIELRFSVSDTGIGIHRDNQVKVFEAFRQADASTTRRFGGTGLGLSIAAQLVQLMGGSIWLESEPGKGTRVNFTARFGLGEEAADADRALLSGQRVLVVDDNATTRRILREILASWRVAPVAVDGGAAALEELARATSEGRAYAVVILDCMMPGMDGFEVAEHIVRDASLGRPGMIMMSSTALPEHTERSRRLGVLRHMTKPIVQSDLLDTLLTVIAGRVQQGAEEGKSLRVKGDRRLSVLVAEDGAVNQKVAKGLLERGGHAVTVVGNGREALQAWEGGHFDVILMDVQMPELDGIAATVELRRREKESGRYTPVLALTAAATDEDIKACREAGMDGHVAKPIDGAALNRRLQDVVRGKDAPVAKAAARGYAASAGVMDIDVARRRIPGGEKEFKELVEVMVEECPRLMQEIHAGLASGDAERVRLGAHSMRNAGDVFAGARVVEAASVLETMGRVGDLSKTADAVAHLETEVQQLTTALQALLE